MRKLLLATLLTVSLESAMAETKGIIMDFGALDTIDALGEANSVVGLPKQNAPEYLKQYSADQYQSTGGMKEPNIEVIRNAKPDFIVISGRQGKFLEELQSIAPVINFSGDKDYLKSAQMNIMAVGKAVGKEKEAQEAWGKLSQKIEASAKVADASSKKAIVVLHNNGNVWVSNQSGYAALVHDVLNVKRADTTEGEARAEADVKYLTEKNPDIIFIVDRSAAIGVEPLKQDHFLAKEFADVSAVKNGKVIYLTPKLWYLSGRGLQSLDLQIDEVMNALK